jgi:hypothetical protein
MAVIKVPRTPRKAFDRTRNASSLLLKQIEHLEWAVLPASQRKPGQLPKKRVKYEGQAAVRIGQLTEMVVAANRLRLEPPVAADAGPMPPVVLPPIPPAPSRAAGGPPARRAAPRRRRR